MSLAVYACAKGGAPVEDDVNDPDARVDGSTVVDARINVIVDASVPPDSPTTIDAFVPPIDAFVPPPDAGNPLTCTINNDCVLPGTCCFVFQCVEGTGVGEDLCFPA